MYHIKDFIDEATIIYIPFSYGGSKKYYNFLQREIKKMKLEKNVIFIHDFMEYNEYKKLLSQCSIAIFGHIRQQAIGNARLMLSLGAKVFFFKDSISYDFFSKAGFKVHNIEEDFNLSTLANNTPVLNEKIIEAINKRNDYDQYLNDLKKSFDVFL